MKRLLLVGALVCFAFGIAIAQRTVSGNVTDVDGQGLIGASILVEGTTSGTVSDIDGSFSLAVPDGGEVLIVSYTGFTTEKVVLEEGRTTYDIALEENAAQLGEVVVTALGIERRRDEDLSSATLVKADVLQRSGETGVVQGLAGKTSGINITRNSGDPGSGAYIQIRGQNTILGDASPLIILDGVPISNSNIGGGTGGVVQQSRLNDINPQDIESITVLKGASAAAVYGTGAANGVLVINTKRGRTGGKRFTVNAGISYGLDEVNREYEKQGVFGQGSPFTTENFEQFGSYVPNTGLSWGDRIADRSGTDVVNENGGFFTGDQTGTVYYPITEKGDRTVYNDVNRDQIFQTGSTLDMNVGINFRGDNSNTYVSFSNLQQEGLLRGNSDYDRTTIRINQDFNLTDKVSIRVNSSYSGVESNRIQTGSNLAGLYLGYLRTSPDFDNTDYSGVYTDADGIARNGHRGYRNYLGTGIPAYNNPGWTINRQLNPSEVDRFLVAPEINYNILPNLKLTARYGLDYYTDERRTVFPVLSAGDYGQGGLFRDEITEKTQNIFLILNGNTEISDAFALDYTVGYNYYDNDYQRLSGSATNLLVPSDKFVIENAIASNNGSTQALSRNRKNGVFGVLNFTIVENLLVELSGRAERTASLPDELFFYPSASLGYKLLDDDAKTVSFAKLRASYGEVGIEPPLYRNLSTFVSTSPGSGGWGDVLDGLNYGGTYARSAVQGNPNLTNEIVKEFEVGGDFRFFQNRLSLGLTYYDRITEDALLQVETPPSSGFTSRFANIAEITNTGFELDFSYNIINDGEARWRLFGNASHNENIVTKLPDVSRLILNGFTSTSSALVEGAPFGALYGGMYLRDEDGDFALNENGFPTNDVVQGVIGDPNPDWRGGLGSEVTYKGIALSVLFETAQGQDMWNGTKGVMQYFGIDPITANISTAPSDIKNAAGATIPAGTEFRGNVIDFGAGPVAADASWYLGNGGGFGSIDEQYIEDASWTRLREVTLSYNLPVTLLAGVGLSNVSVGITGRNLLLWTPFEGADPDTNLTGASRGRGLAYFNNPGSRSVLFNLKFGF
ncbi:TonB-linked SusC/RagA family outer membrane protein [Neolewinella xylanilytica]|uniref:TonB-linked SusC/RagA family outer membrane protein n=1 Tax=Neolewinella xylanilytica TaxID=1514080 RepID=A0A2S6IBF5_9BACT|nr:SusC/RagA family TonB-linked outer membrane protein [Neolewinella xylanilytica]PPK88847.1 TonB-linked SusC/RagA family outer membrane protein [Neolewinella xylanilytica]